MAYVLSRGVSRLSAWPEGFVPMEAQMRTTELKQLLAMTRRLTPSQQEELMAQLTDDVARDEVGTVIQGKPLRAEAHLNGTAAGFRLGGCGANTALALAAGCFRDADLQSWPQRHSMRIDSGLGTCIVGTEICIICP